jgi:hypothetical protein
MSACSLTKTLSEDEYLLMKNKIKVVSDETKRSELPRFKEQIRQKPNRKTLGISRMYLRIYHLGTSTKDSSKNNRWVRRKLRNIGEAPVIFDSSFADRSSKNITQFLFNHGYFHAHTHFEVTYSPKKVKKATYIVNPGKAYTLESYTWDTSQSELVGYFQNNMSRKWLIEGQRLELGNIGLERDRVFNMLRNNGFYALRKDHIDFEIDTNHLTHQAKVHVVVQHAGDSFAFKRFRIREVDVYITDGVEKIPVHSEGPPQGIRYHMRDFPLQNRILEQQIQLYPRKSFKQRNVDETYKRLSELGIFNQVNIEFFPAPYDSVGLITRILLTPGYQKSYSMEPQLISSDLNNQIANVGNYRNYGIANVFTYTHKNAFRGAERLDISWTTRMETQFRTDDELNRFFTNFQTGITAQMLLPATRIWEDFARKRAISSVRTLLTSSYIYENNVDFNRHILPVGFSYQFVKKYNTFFFTPLEVFYSKSQIGDGFFDKISPRNIDFVKRLFSSNLITSTGLRWNHTHFFKGNLKDYIILRSNILEVGGHVHRLGRVLMDNERNRDTSYRFLGVSYFQFVKTEWDLRLSKPLNTHNVIAARVNIGIGLPYGNENLLPFDKRFFIGGSNSLRGWRPRSLGPGSFRDTASGNRIDRSGELVLQASAEYRFTFISPLELALFMDAGNIWNVIKSPEMEEKEIFRFNRFWNDIAINTGIGFRFDFNFFVFRLDWGIQLKDPEVTANKGWVAYDIGRKGWLKNTLLSLGIGYPF